MKAAPSRHLAQWWNDNANGVDVYIGQDVQRTMNTPDPGNKDKNELDTKVRLSRTLPNVGGNVWWHGYWVTDNYKGVADSLALKYQSTIALPPVYGEARVKPASVKGLRLEQDDRKTYLVWDKANTGKMEKETDVVRYVVYQFFPVEKIDLDDSQTIISVTPENGVAVADAGDKIGGCTFVVTALDRMNRESDPVSIKVK